MNIFARQHDFLARTNKREGQECLPLRFSNGIESSEEIGAGYDSNSFTAYLEHLAYMPELLEQGIEVAVIGDAIAVVQIPEVDGYLAALINIRFMANVEKRCQVYFRIPYPRDANRANVPQECLGVDSLVVE